jgi:membrane-associated phospholipid phosphatase
MGPQHEVTVETFQQAPAGGRSYTLARIISQVFHPMALGVLSFLIVGYFALPGRFVGLAWALLGVGLQIVPVFAFFTIRMRQGAYSDEDVSIRSQRNELYLFSMINLLVGLVVLVLLQTPLPFLALLCGALLLGVSAALINLRWKISVHASTAASCATIALLYDRPLGLALWLCAFLVGWSRVRTRNHTSLQVLAGYGLATVCVWLTFRAFGLV